MRLFSCSNCRQVAFFENTQCLGCGAQLGFFPDMLELHALEPCQGKWQARGWTGVYRKCNNYEFESTCNWMVSDYDSSSLCVGCRFNRTIPDLSEVKNRKRWYRLEVAKKRLLFWLYQRKLPIRNRQEDPQTGLAFDFLVPGRKHVLSGHADGIITINAVEADDEIREQMRINMNEPYRTLLGHFRHEIAHYYWHVFVAPPNWGRLESFRAVFGNEQVDYAQALQAHYDFGPPSNWLDLGFISAYASSHPWEDWAETWAHYVHLTDALETAAQFGLALPEDQSQGIPVAIHGPGDGMGSPSFEAMLNDWQRLVFAINSINRSLGISDLYPFVLAPAVYDKLRFIHVMIAEIASSPG